MKRAKRKGSSAARRPLSACSDVLGRTIAIDDCGGRYYFDNAEAERICEFFPKFLRHFEGEFAGKPFELLPWQRDIVIRPLFGWRRKSDSTRRFRKLILFVPRKNGKTSLVAGIALVLLFSDREPAALIDSAAADRKQAALAFNAAKAMMVPALRKRCELYKRSIFVPGTLSAYHVLSADAKSAHGGNPHGIICDELHAWPNRLLFEALSTGRAARRQPLLIEISTAGDDFEGLCREEYETAKKLISGVIEDETILPVIFEADPEDDWRDPEVWAKANPSFGVTVKPDYIREECATAIAESRKQAAFKRLHLNIWTQQHTVWIDLADWDACKDPLDRNGLAGVPCWAGLDLSTKQDLTSLALAFRREDEGPAIELEVAAAEDAAGKVIRKKLNLNYSIDLLLWFWIPEETMYARARTDNVPYPLWAQEGYVTPTPGNMVDYDYIFDQVQQEIAPRYKILEVGYDPWNASQFALNLQDAGFKMVEVRQGAQSLSEPSKIFEALIKAKRIRHGGHKILRWNVSNVAVREDKKGNIFPFKIQQKARIDGVIASVIALSRMIVSPARKKGSVYASRDLRVL